jgi:uncharacterized damage-inducible protein DinB
MDLGQQLLDTWAIHDRIHHYLLDAVDPAALGAVSASKGRTVGEQFAHIHNVRRMWLTAAAADLAATVEKLEKPEKGPGGESFDKERLHAALSTSAAVVAELLARSLAGDGRIKGFKPHVTAFVGYLISHESHHRGQILLTLKQAGRPVDKKTAFGIWEWGVR